MKTAHIVIAGLAVAGLGYWYYKKKGTIALPSLNPNTKQPAPVVSDATPQTASSPIYTIANDQVQVAKTTGPIPVLMEYTQPAASPPPVFAPPQVTPTVKTYDPAPYVAPAPAPMVTLPPPPVKAPCKYVNGQLLRSSDKVFQVDDNCTRHWVPGNVYSRLKLKGTDIRQISATEMATTPEGAALTGLAGYSNMMF